MSRWSGFLRRYQTGAQRDARRLFPWRGGIVSITFTRSPAAIRWKARSTRSRWRACISLPLVRTAASDPGDWSMAICRSTMTSWARRSGDAFRAIWRRSSSGSIR